MFKDRYINAQVVNLIAGCNMDGLVPTRRLKIMLECVVRYILSNNLFPTRSYRIPMVRNTTCETLEKFVCLAKKDKLNIKGACREIPMDNHSTSL